MTLVCKAPRATRATSVSAVPLAHLASQVLLELRDSQASVVLSVLSGAVALRERGVHPARWAPVDLRATRATVACEDLRVCAARLATQAPVAPVVTRASRALVV